MAARAGDRAAVTGLGLVGNLAALLRGAGLRVLGAEPLAERRRVAERCGIPETFDPTAGVGSHEAACAAVLEVRGRTAACSRRSTWLRAMARSSW